MENANLRAAEAILAFAQSEKIKSALISIAQALQILPGLVPEERVGAEKVIRLFLGMAMQEISLAKRVAEGLDWNELEALLERALVMIDSGVAQEASVLLARAISLATTAGQRAMIFLRDQHLL
jgi:hypothetical protein